LEESSIFEKEVGNMTTMSATIGRMCDDVRAGWKDVHGDWKEWGMTYRALTETYYKGRFAAADSAYCLAGLQQFQTAWMMDHGHKDIAQEFLDAACAHEVRYHASRGRIFRRPCAALSTCWRAIVNERPERVTDRAARKTEYARRKAKVPDTLGIPISKMTAEEMRQLLERTFPERS
jgi:hypothetical protein